MLLLLLLVVVVVVLVVFLSLSKSILPLQRDTQQGKHVMYLYSRDARGAVSLRGPAGQRPGGMRQRGHPCYSPVQQRHKEGES
jgi:hypothetical protein